jgi:hypothetical protein
VSVPPKFFFKILLAYNSCTGGYIMIFTYVLMIYLSITLNFQTTSIQSWALSIELLPSSFHLYFSHVFPSILHKFSFWELLVYILRVFCLKEVHVLSIRKDLRMVLIESCDYPWTNHCIPGNVSLAFTLLCNVTMSYIPTITPQVWKLALEN